MFILQVIVHHKGNIIGDQDKNKDQKCYGRTLLPDLFLS